MTDTYLTIRRAEVEDARSIGTIHVRSWQQGYKGLLPDKVLDSFDIDKRVKKWQSKLLEEEKNGLKSSGWVTHIAEVSSNEGETIIGFSAGGVYRSDDNNDKTAELIVYVDPDYWRVGAGKMLTDFTLYRLSQAGFKDVVIWVVEGNERALRFYDKTGWVSDGQSIEESLWGVKKKLLSLRKKL